MKITFEKKEDKIYRLGELEIGDTFILYDLLQDNLDEVFMKTDTDVVRLNDGHTMNFVNSVSTFQKVEVELIVRGNFDV